MPVHPPCGKSFPEGSRAGHCAACHETFVGGAGFDNHRVGKHGTPDRRCEIKPYETVNEQGVTIYGHWQDDRGYWHYGKQLTDEEKKAIFKTNE